MENAWDWVKGHPVYIAGGLAILAIIYFAYSASSGSGSATTTYAGATGPTDAAVNAAASVQTAQLQLTAQTNQVNAALQANESNNAAGITIAGLQAQVATYQTEQAANVQELGITATKDIQLAGLATQTAIAQSNNDVITHQADLASSVAIANAATFAQIASLQSAENIARVNAAVTVATVPYAAAVAINHDNNATQQAQLTAISGPNGQALQDALYRSQSVTGSYLNIGGITATRGGTPSTNAQGTAAAFSGISSLVSSIGALFA
jgi:hypothetical protein